MVGFESKMVWTNYWLLIMGHAIKRPLVLPWHIPAITPLEARMAGWAQWG